MATLKDIRKRINSVKSTQQITKAMKMVSSAKLMRAQERLLEARPYREEMEKVVGRVLMVEDIKHPLVEPREEILRLHLVVFTSDRGLCGGFNANLLRNLMQYLRDNKENYAEILLTVLVMACRPGRRISRKSVSWISDRTAASMSLTIEVAAFAESVKMALSARSRATGTAPSAGTDSRPPKPGCILSPWPLDRTAVCT